MQSHDEEDEDESFDYNAFIQQQAEINDERWPSRPPSQAPSSSFFYSDHPQPAAQQPVFAASVSRPRTSQSLLTGPISGISISRPTSAAFSMAGVRDRRWQSSTSVVSRTPVAPASAARRRSNETGGSGGGNDDDDEDADNLDAFITSDYYEEARYEKGHVGEKWKYTIPVSRRTWGNWVHRIVVYVIIVGFFAGFHLGMWALFWASVDLNNPAYSHYILLEPALNFRPRPRGDDWGTFLHWNRRDRKAINELLDSMNKAIESYEEEIVDDPNGDKHTWTKVCDFENPTDDENACWIDTRAFGTYCYKSQLYGYDDGKPCILIRINKVVNWVPESFENVAELKAAGFPLDWKEEDFTKNFIPISCEGQTDIDKELLGPIRYFYPLRPYNGLATYYFPFTGQLHYAPPGVMVNFYNLTFAVPIRIVCKLWAKNVKHRRDGPVGHLTGAVEFELMIDSGIVGQDERKERDNF